MWTWQHACLGVAERPCPSNEFTLSEALSSRSRSFCSLPHPVSLDASRASRDAPPAKKLTIAKERDGELATQL